MSVAECMPTKHLPLLIASSGAFLFTPVKADPWSQEEMAERQFRSAAKG
jgi:hypothetical protein